MASLKKRPLKKAFVVTLTSSALASCIIGNPPGPNPEPDLCPVDMPRIGTACTDSVVCAYPDTCGLSLSAQDTKLAVTCQAGVWALAEPNKVGKCPRVAPQAGADCRSCSALVMKSCGYQLCMTYPTIQASCIGDKWEVLQISCNPPPPDLGM